MTMSFPRQKLLCDLRQQPRGYNPKNKPQQWAIDAGYATEANGRVSITQAGLASIEYEELPPEAKAARKLLPRLSGRVLVRTASATEEGKDGGGYVYSTEPDHKPFPTVSGRVMVERGWLEPAEDGLFAGMSQTFRVPAHA